MQKPVQRNVLEDCSTGHLKTCEDLAHSKSQNCSKGTGFKLKTCKMWHQTCNNLCTKMFYFIVFSVYQPEAWHHPFRNLCSAECWKICSTGHLKTSEGLALNTTKNCSQGFGFKLKT
jgi:hypothetical protein